MLQLISNKAKIEVLLSRRLHSPMAHLLTETAGTTNEVFSNALWLYEDLWKREKEGSNLVARIDGHMVDYFISRPKSRLKLILNRIRDYFSSIIFSITMSEEAVQAGLKPILDELQISLEELINFALVTYQELIELHDGSGGLIYLRRPLVGGDQNFEPWQSLIEQTQRPYLVSDPFEPFVLFE